jgi:hypothetical protein
MGPDLLAVLVKSKGLQFGDLLIRQAEVLLMP